MPGVAVAVRAVMGTWGRGISSIPHLLWYIVERCLQVFQFQIARTEVVPPLGDTMSFVDDEPVKGEDDKDDAFHSPS